MDMKDFSATNRLRCEHPQGFRHQLSSWSLSDWMTATLGELGEAANVAKKLNRVRDGVPGNRMIRLCPACGRRWPHSANEKVYDCVCKCNLRNLDPVPDPTLEAELRAALRAEIADTFIYLDLLAQSQGFLLEDAVREKFDATSAKLGFPFTCFREREVPS